MMIQTRTKRLMVAAIAVAAQAIFSGSAMAQAVNVSGKSNIAISGHDPVAFFTQKKPMHGNFKITSKHQGATYFFVNERHKALFDANPTKYAPQCGGYCAFGVSVGALLPVDINTWQVRNDKLYLNLNPQIVKLFNQNLDANIAKAEKNWPRLAAQAAGDLVNTSGKSNVALDGHDPVAFFTMKKATHGNFKIASQHRGATYFFANKQHKSMFDSNPDKYAPQCGGFCAFGVSVGALFPVDIKTWQVRNDKLYLNLNPQIVQAFNKDLDANIAKAEKNWPGLVAKSNQKKASAMKK
jgi:YHS domain-containing protein